jgi:hypothetical protein
MRNFTALFLTTLILGLPTASFARSDKCSALAKLAATIYENRQSINEYQMLRGMEHKSAAVDFAFIRLFSGIAYGVNKSPPPDFKQRPRNSADALKPPYPLNKLIPQQSESIM